MILADREIAAALEAGSIRIHPVPDKSLWTSTALDLTLDKVVLEWKDPVPPDTGMPPHLRPFGQAFNITSIMNDPNHTKRVEIHSENGYLLKPKEFVLGYTREIVQLPHRSRIAARVEGKSSLARVGVGVHVTAPTIHAGFGYNPEDPSFVGSPIQLEIFNLGKLFIILDVGMPICQLILEEVREVPLKGYQGRFQEQTSFGSK